MKISIVIPLYNSSKFIRQTLQSVLDQTYHDWELLLINDGSTDNTAEIAREYTEKYSQIRYYEKTNGGIASARNYGLHRARKESDAIIFLDHDDVWKPDCLEVLSDLLEKDKEALAAPGNADIIDENGLYLEKLIKNDSSRIRMKYENGKPVKLLPSEPTTFESEVFNHAIATMGQILFRKDVVLQVNGFDTALRTSDDVDIYFRLLYDGYFAYTEQPVVSWRKHAENSSVKGYLWEIQNIYVYKKSFYCPSLSSYKRNILNNAYKYHLMKNQFLRLNWAKNALFEGRVIISLKQIRHFILLYFQIWKGL
jgi:glycosyltransferase involved in cell wall biosynthesis